MGKLSVAEIQYWVNEIKADQARQTAELLKRNNYPWIINYYEGFQHIRHENGRVSIDQNVQRAVINDYFPNTNAIIAENMYKNPDITAEATKPTAEEQAPTMKAGLSYAFDKLDALNENRIAFFDMIFAGFCAVEVNHINLPETEFTISPDVLEKQRQEGNFLQKAVKKITGGVEEVETQVEEEIPPIEARFAIQSEIMLRRWDPLNILLDHRANRVKELRRITKKLWFTPAEFNTRYPKFKNMAKATGQLPFADHKNDMFDKLVLVYEIQVKKTEGRYQTIVIAPSIKTSELDIFDRPYTTNGFNIKIGSLHKYGRLYPIATAKINKAIQDDVNNYVQHMGEVAKRNIPKRGYNKNKVKEDGVTALQSPNVMDNVPVDGGSESIWALPHGNVSVENKELLQIFRQQSDKTWSMSAERVGGQRRRQFAEELKVQEAGFQTTQGDIQEGLRLLIQDELNTTKDIIVTFWDKPIWFKITDKPKPVWYEPQLDPLTGRVLNPLSELLVADYFIKVDISTSFRPNKERLKEELSNFLLAVTSPQFREWLQSQGKDLNIEMFKKLGAKFGLSEEALLVDFDTPAALPGEEGAPGAGV